MPRRPEPRARARALQAVYAWDLRAGAALPRVAADVWDDLAVGADERALAQRLVTHLHAHAAALDAVLTDVTMHWRLSRLGVVERSVLRLAAAELDLGETPPKVVIQEALRLAERFGTPESARFVNGVLDALARRMGRLA
jgi:N utilization substance protein B